MSARLAALLVLPLLSGGARQAAAEDIVSYCGGGVTGGGGGLRIKADGTVLRLRRARAGAPIEESRLDTNAAYERIAVLLDEAGFERMPPGAPSNMTCSITRHWQGKAHAVIWSIGHAPAALQPVLHEMEAAGR